MQLFKLNEPEKKEEKPASDISAKLAEYINSKYPNHEKIQVIDEYTRKFYTDTQSITVTYLKKSKTFEEKKRWRRGHKEEQNSLATVSIAEPEQKIVYDPTPISIKSEDKKIPTRFIPGDKVVNIYQKSEPKTVWTVQSITFSLSGNEMHIANDHDYRTVATSDFKLYEG